MNPTAPILPRNPEEMRAVLDRERLMKKPALRNATPLALITFGSHLYGTARPDSDRDLKGVFIPGPRELLLQRAPETVREGSSDPNTPNTADDVDVEWLSLGKFLEMLSQGQANAVDLAFAPRDRHLFAPSPLWDEIAAAAPRLINRNIRALVGYCRKQANIYSLKGERLRGARAARDLIAAAIARHGVSDRLSVIEHDLRALAASEPYVEVADEPHAAGQLRPVLRVGGRGALLSQSLQEAYASLDRMVEGYGARARAAEDAGAKDWKAMMHAVRIADEALELTRTGRVTLPRPDADRLLAIRRGELDWDALGEEIGDKLKILETGDGENVLPAQPDHGFIEKTLLRAHRAVIDHSPVGTAQVP